MRQGVSRGPEPMTDILPAGNPRQQLQSMVAQCSGKRPCEATQGQQEMRQKPADGVTQVGQGRADKRDVGSGKVAAQESLTAQNHRQQQGGCRELAGNVGLDPLQMAGSQGTKAAAHCELVAYSSSDSETGPDGMSGANEEDQLDSEPESIDGVETPQAMPLALHSSDQQGPSHESQQPHVAVGAHQARSHSHNEGKLVACSAQQATSQAAMASFGHHPEAVSFDAEAARQIQAENYALIEENAKL
ncbi:hypothetical protein WJX74_002848 [Apatococcus lobatus]|uniref:Uncharacterized protein n=1 Tax=Apatococcus lobatus TaxID=904363 RepID=A0AAW1RRZ1_9CHLO